MVMSLRRAIVACVLSSVPVGALAETPDASCDAIVDCRPLEFSFSYTGDWRRNTTGGMAVGDAYSSLAEFGATLTAIPLRSGGQWSASIAVMHSGGDGVSESYVGDLHGVNNIEAPQAWRLYELWSEVRFGKSASTSVRLGILDLNAEFDAPATSEFFVGPAHGIGTEFAQTGLNGPAIWPVTGFGLRVAHAYRSGITVRLGAYDAVPGKLDDERFAYVDLSHSEGALLVGELEYSNERFNKLSMGFWSYTARFDRIDPTGAPSTSSSHGNRGIYGLIDLPIRVADERKLNAFVRVGYADPRFNPLRSYIGAGVVAEGLLSSRPQDALGLAMSFGELGRPYRGALLSAEGAAESNETALELSYRAPIVNWLSLVPTVQWVSHPGASASLRDAWIAGLRFELSASRRAPWIVKRAGESTDALARAEQ